MATLRELIAMNNRYAPDFFMEVNEDIGLSAKHCNTTGMNVPLNQTPEALIASLENRVQSLRKLLQTGSAGTRSTLGLETLSLSTDNEDTDETDEEMTVETVTEPDTEDIIRTEEWFNANESATKSTEDGIAFGTFDEIVALKQRIDTEGATIMRLNRYGNDRWTMTVTGEKGTYEIASYEGWETVKEEEGF